MNKKINILFGIHTILAIHTYANNQSEIEKLKAKKKAFELENKIHKSQLEKELDDKRATLQRLRLEKEFLELTWTLEKLKLNREHAKAILVLQHQKEKLIEKIAFNKAKNEKITESYDLELAKLNHKNNLLKTELNFHKTAINNHKMAHRKNNYVDSPINYSSPPFVDNKTLIISDRRIELNGLITYWKANYITDCINYYNNKNTNYPIFIIINNSVGGSVKAGYSILKAMQNSKAPVYVVVKSFAASMAAVITALAKTSFAYPNAIILHHEVSAGTFGPLRLQKEGYEITREYQRKLLSPIAKKMNISLEQLIKKFYEKSAFGDWQEFADNAKKLKWVDHIIHEIKDQSKQAIPNSKEYTFAKYVEDYFRFGFTKNPEAITQNSLEVVYLPELEPKDMYYVYNKNNRYKVLPVEKQN